MVSQRLCYLIVFIVTHTVYYAATSVRYLSTVSGGAELFLEEFCRSAGKTASADAAELAGPNLIS